MQDKSDNFHTFDGVEITPNLRVFGYDWQWGNVEPTQFGRTGPSSIRFGQYFDGWYNVILDDGKRALYNGTRMITVPMMGARKYADPNPERRIGKNGNVECSKCLSVTMGTCLDPDCNCHHS